MDHIVKQTVEARESENNRVDLATVSVIVVNYNVADLLIRCLDSVVHDNGVRPPNISVVDNGSTDGSIQRVMSRFPEVTIIANSVNQGFAAAVNRGLLLAREEHILILNPDTLLPPNCLVRLLRFLDANPTIGMVGPRLVRSDGTLDYACRRNFPTPLDIYLRITGLDRLFPQSRLFGHYNLTYLDPAVSCEVDCIAGAFMLVRQEAIAKVGPMDERFFMYAEDVDWACRFKRAGWRVHYCADVEVLHYKQASTKQIKRQMIREFYKAIYQCYEKYCGPATPTWASELMKRSLQIRMILALCADCLGHVFQKEHLNNVSR